MSPALFTLFSDLLSRLLAKAEMEEILSGVKGARTSPRVTHLMYIDDLVVYHKATTKEAHAIVSILEDYCHGT